MAPFHLLGHGVTTPLTTSVHMNVRNGLDDLDIAEECDNKNKLKHNNEDVSFFEKKLKKKDCGVA
jgi:F420-0:gamma-glutamyl ligase-like protein